MDELRCCRVERRPRLLRGESEKKAWEKMKKIQLGKRGKRFALLQSHYYEGLGLLFRRSDGGINTIGSIQRVSAQKPARALNTQEERKLLCPP